MSLFNNSMGPADLAAVMGNNNDGFGVLSEARSEAEREVFRRKLDELNRQM